ncbi:unnamed protein product [Miscanthus lutarioriparius]|uniref:Uncharacterized protein n=1 Tax=Miscanthus lutarioriparius TaxID=422564 RepID=A0A811SMQ6_9POAL|nr:unnamed protein product [Miscanthus lutarioriparius]
MADLPLQISFMIILAQVVADLSCSGKGLAKKIFTSKKKKGSTSKRRRTGDEEEDWNPNPNADVEEDDEGDDEEMDVSGYTRAIRPWNFDSCETLRRPYQYALNNDADLPYFYTKWMTGKRRYSATFDEFAIANELDNGFFANSIDLDEEDPLPIEQRRQFYEPKRTKIQFRIGGLKGLRHHLGVINKIARVTFMPEGGARGVIRDEY